MGTESLKLMAGALALGRFTSAELAAFSDVNGKTALSWVKRKKKSAHLRSVSTEASSQRGRPSKIWELEPRAAEEFNALFQNMPAGEIERSLEGTAPLMDLSTSLSQIQSLFDLFESTKGQERENITEWLEESLQTFSIQIESRHRGGLSVSSDNLALFSKIRKAFRAADRDLSLDRSLVTFDGHTLLVSMREVLDDLSGTGFTSSEHPLPHSLLGSEIKTLGLLATVGVCDSLRLPKEAKRTMVNVASNITPDRYVECLNLCVVGTNNFTSPVEVAPLLNGIRMISALRESSQVADWLDDHASTWSMAIPGAYAMTRLQMPNSHVGEVASVIETMEYAHAASAFVTAGSEYGWFGGHGVADDVYGLMTAVQTVTEHTADYGLHFVRYIKPAKDLQTDSEQFSAKFLPQRATA